MDVMGNDWLLMSLVHVLLGNCMVRVVPTGCGLDGVIVAISELLARLTKPGVNVIAQFCKAPGRSWITDAPRGTA